MGTDVQKWADEAMFRSESHNAQEGPKVHLLAMNADPLGQIAACAKMYKGEVVRDLSEVTDAERRYYLEEMKKTKLKMPLESVTFHFMLENVTRGFTHQLVRQRTAAYAQESMRFAVVEDMTQAVSLPPSIAGTTGKETPGAEDSTAEWQRNVWDHAVHEIHEAYLHLIDSGMPAEDARGLMPTNIITRVNYITNLRGLLDHAGNRLCTQAQFEWRLVFAQIAKAIREYRPSHMGVQMDGVPMRTYGAAEQWQFEEISKLFKPVCYQTGRCEFGADFDRKCSIRNRVQANASQGIPSTEWGEDHYGDPRPDGTPVFIGAIQTAEWLANPAAAR